MNLPGLPWRQGHRPPDRLGPRTWDLGASERACERAHRREARLRRAGAALGSPGGLV